MPTLAKLFSHGGSQAVRLTREFRLPGTAVHVRRVGADVILSPRPPASMAELFHGVARTASARNLGAQAPRWPACRP